MKIVSMIGAMIVTLALVFYSLGFTKERKLRRVTSRVLLFYTIGITLDITATILMIIGSSKGMLTVHGFIGYSSLLGMLVDTSMLWKFNRKLGPDKEVSAGLHKYSRVAYSWWVIAYITGGLLVALSKMSG
ncbi:MAG: hypothetical protein WCR72_08600 [Bacteroidota bacterium]